MHTVLGFVKNPLTTVKMFLEIGCDMSVPTLKNTNNGLDIVLVVIKAFIKSNSRNILILLPVIVVQKHVLVA